MNVKEYISSGIVESYVLGLADEAERAEFESMCASYPEVLAARDAFELSLEQQALEGAGVAPRSVKNNIFAELDLTPGAASFRSAPVVEKTQPAVVVKSSGFIRYLAAASVVLLIGSTALNFWFYKEYRGYSTKYENLLASQNQLASNNQVLQTSLDNYKTNLARIRDTSMSVIRMIGGAVPQNGSPDPSSVATIYWDKKNTEVFMLVNNLPKAPSDKQYQLWAIVNGKPVSAGVFDVNENSEYLLKMTNISGPAAAFAVTLEKRGGSETPQGAMYVLGAI